MTSWHYWIKILSRASFAQHGCVSCGCVCVCFLFSTTKLAKTIPPELIDSWVWTETESVGPSGSQTGKISSRWILRQTHAALNKPILPCSSVILDSDRDGDSASAAQIEEFKQRIIHLSGTILANLARQTKSTKSSAFCDIQLKGIRVVVVSVRDTIKANWSWAWFQVHTLQ